MTTNGKEELAMALEKLDRDATPPPWYPPSANGYRLYSWLTDTGSSPRPLTCIISDATDEAHWGFEQVPGADGMKAWANVQLIALLRNSLPDLIVALRPSPPSDITEWVTVPRVPTEEMYAAAEREWDGRMSARSAGVWQAMISAAPVRGRGVA